VAKKTSRLAAGASARFDRCLSIAVGLVLDTVARGGAR
jgi:hypothetical protein